MQDEASDVSRPFSFHFFLPAFFFFSNLCFVLSCIYKSKVQGTSVRSLRTPESKADSNVHLSLCTNRSNYIQQATCMHEEFQELCIILLQCGGVGDGGSFQVCCTVFLINCLAFKQLTFDLIYIDCNPFVLCSAEDVASTDLIVLPVGPVICFPGKKRLKQNS